jgi:RND family efflux transporter MFP subunit
MNKIIILLSITIFLAACGAQPAEQLSADLTGLKSQLAKKENELVGLKDEIVTLKKRIEELDPDFGNRAIQAVDVLEIQKGEFRHFVEVQATIEAGESKLISSEIPGQIVNLYVKEGTQVKRGQLIATLDGESMRKNIEELETGLGLARDLYERQKRLWEKSIGSEIQYLQARNNMERLEKSLEAARISLKKTNIYSPLTGTVARLMNKEGEIASPGVPILHIISIGKVKVLADVPEVHIQDIQRRDMVKLKVPVLDFESEVPVYRLGQIIDENNRTFDVEVRVNNPGYRMKPNMLAILQINDYYAKDAVSVPLELVQQDVSGDSYVYVVRQEENQHFVSKRIVKTGVAFEGIIEVTAGLSGEEQLITTGIQYLADGEEITLNTSQS